MLLGRRGDSETAQFYDTLYLNIPLSSDVTFPFRRQSFIKLHHSSIIIRNLPADVPVLCPIWRLLGPVTRRINITFLRIHTNIPHHRRRGGSKVAFYTNDMSHDISGKVWRLDRANLEQRFVFFNGDNGIMLRPGLRRDMILYKKS